MTRTKPLTKILSLTLAAAALGGGMAASANASAPFAGASDGVRFVNTGGPWTSSFAHDTRAGVAAKWHDNFASIGLKP